MRPTTPGPTTRRGRRTGNATVLAVGVLVLLAVIATSYLTKTHSGRLTSTALQRNLSREQSASQIANSLASEIALALFPAPVDTNDPCINPNNITCANAGPDSSYPRLSPAFWNTALYGVDPVDQLDNGTGLPIPGGDDIRDFPFNFAPYNVVPWTNWPDANTLMPGVFAAWWPQGDGNPGGTNTPGTAWAAEDNPAGNPGFGDTRWLRDSEPIRWNSEGSADPFNLIDAMLFWRHLTNIARPNNGWRVCRDIANVYQDLVPFPNGDGVYETPNVVTDLSIPVEQWMVIQPQPNPGFGAGPLYSNLTGNAIFKFGDFGDKWRIWFDNHPNPLLRHHLEHANPIHIPPNLYKLNDLDGDGITVEPGERPGDQFKGPSTIWPQGSPRWNVGRVLADTDGDTFTDSFWFLAPTSVESGVAQVVAVSITDNSALIDANVATRFNCLNTTGATPADIALVGENSGSDWSPPADSTWNVGFFDNWLARETFFGFPTPYGSDVFVGWDRLEWIDFVNEIGWDAAVPMSAFELPADRLAYWQNSGRRPFAPLAGLTPFTPAEELELRMFNGCNHPWILSRLEMAFDSDYDPPNYILRAYISREESSEYGSSPTNKELLFDHRHRLTCFSGARNDLLPPWLSWENRWEMPSGSGGPNQNYMIQARRKLDLRDTDNTILLPLRTFERRLREDLMLAFTDGDATGGDSWYGSHGGPNNPDFENTRRLAGAFAANILSYRDPDHLVPLLSEAVEKPGVGLTPLHQAQGNPQVLEDATIRYVGMERQPFLVGALIGHVYHYNYTVPQCYTNTGDHIVLGDQPGPFLPKSTIVVVQIANPFDDTLTQAELAGFRLSVFGQDVVLGGYGDLLPGQALTLYSMEDTLGGEDLDDSWRQALGLDGGPTSMANPHSVSGVWSASPSVYNSGDEERAVELIRVLADNTPLVVDRIDLVSETDYDFGDAVTTRLREPTSLQNPVPGDCLNPFPWDFGGIDIGANTHWVSWAYTTRDWDDDYDGTPGIQADERNPRYVFAKHSQVPIDAYETRYVLGAGGDIVADPGFDPLPNDLGSRDKDCDAPDCPDRQYSMQMLQKDGDFEQVGELLNVWLFGHEVETNPTGGYVRTMTTFGEFMADEQLTGDSSALFNTPGAADARHVNRLRHLPDDGTGTTINPVVGLGTEQAWVPDLPVTARVLDMFVCDGGGLNGVTAAYYNAQAFEGKATPGLININTASPEVMRALPNLYKPVHIEADGTVQPPYPRVALAEAMVHYRERYDGMGTGITGGPDYSDRGATGDLRGERGFASTAEILTMDEEGEDPDGPLPVYSGTTLEKIGQKAWRADAAATSPFAPTTLAAHMSTDVNNPPAPPAGILDIRDGDGVAADSEEANLLFAGISNLITTRSDMFTVYFRVRSFRQNPVTGAWDATDPEHIIDDSRYVMLVDRSRVERPGDKPKIVYIEKLPR